MEAPKTPAQWYAMVVGVVLVAAGILALITGSTNFGTVSDGAGQNFIIWTVSGWETILYMAVGALGLTAMARVDSARSYALIAGTLFAAMAVWGFIDGNDVAAIWAVDTADNVTYAALGGLGLLLGLMPERGQRRAGFGGQVTHG